MRAICSYASTPTWLAREPGFPRTAHFLHALQAVAARGLVDDIATLHLDRGYDNHLVERVCEGFGITDVVCANGLSWPSFGRPTERHPLQPRDQVLVPSLTRCLYPSTLPPPLTAPRP